MTKMQKRHLIALAAGVHDARVCKQCRNEAFWRGAKNFEKIFERMTNLIMQKMHAVTENIYGGIVGINHDMYRKFIETGSVE